MAEDGCGVEITQNFYWHKKARPDRSTMDERAGSIEFRFAWMR